METGMLWFDNDKKRTISSKIEQAVNYYRKKYEREPDTCYLNPQMVLDAGEAIVQKSKGKEEKITVGSVEIHQNPMILPNHFWIGIDNGNGAVTQAG